MMFDGNNDNTIPDSKLAQDLLSSLAIKIQPFYFSRRLLM